MEVIGQLHDSATLPQGKSLWYPLERRLEGFQSQSGCDDEEKKYLCPCWEPNPCHPACSPVTVMIELSQLLPVT
jgi:hypothetical protein